jgi:hypothetical protein
MSPIASPAHPLGAFPRLRTALLLVAALLPPLTTAASPDTAPHWQAEVQAIDRAMRLAQAELLGGDTQAFVAGELEAERALKGAPYCADAVNESVQLLPDAGGAITNRIVRRQQTRLCRDGEGRTRQELEVNGQKRIYLRDPVAGESWVLDPARRTAQRLGRTRWTLPHEMGEHPAWREYGERMREWARGVADRARQAAQAHRAGEGTPPPPAGAPVPPVPPAPPAPPAPVAMPAPVVVTGGETGAGGFNIRILRGDAFGAGEAMLPPGLALRASHLAPRGPAVVTALGSKDIEGVRAGGERSTWTVEAGRVGNEKPIVISREVWRSPDLLLTVSSIDFDPRIGETRYRLSNLRRGEPDPALMQVPADYQRRGGSAPVAPKGRG